ncbi:[NiFe]-hydrogenase assembly chaperone HybE [Albimonas sp. CAU 1670]|uniref:[NiFe]-hydrogenase assembly chaperone HybE n=1 Tax=Albimonas sp. CAU 1670 TaxID=3032599 RepID=UPI0023DB3465|nr:[NiFe]-hydrogenase assembly chaperone HybE [Albimonas sp. CAU 1670]MDF2235639.1 [NiFe]-hydrogenase assembly chaperone HybE [Albimonas sp. CAU 1670]
MTGFEGSYLGAADKISARAIMECKVCWTPYDPEEGDETRLIDAGTAFLDLPEDWVCPNCSAPKAQFLVQSDPGSEAAAAQAWIEARTADLEADFREIWHSRMRDVPLVNAALHIEAVGFALHDGRPLGVLISPWFMNLVELPGPDEDWSAFRAGEKEDRAFASGDYEFTRNARPLTGPYRACSLFSPMGDFSSQQQAREVARAVLLAIHDPANAAETDRAADIRAAREVEVQETALAEARAEAEAEAAAARAADLAAPSRRGLITGGMG